MGRLVLVPLSGLGAGFLADLGERLLAAVPMSGVETVGGSDSCPGFDPERLQYHSTAIVEWLADSFGARRDDRILGVIDQDLFVPILTFVFGEAQLDGPAAVFSLTRLRPTFYGLPANGDTLFDRAVKEALHELGHTFGLRHCPRPECVMRASTTAGDVDLKPAAFCRPCAKRLPRRPRR